MQALINDLLTYSRVGRDRDALPEIDFESVLEMALRNLAIAIRESGAQVTHDKLPTIKVPGTVWSLLFQNLVGNAIKFRREDIQPRIHVGAQIRSSDWLFTVQDNGIGIDEEYFERIFAIFQRLHTRTDYAGTGIGLALCKRIVEHHGGRIWVESTAGKGTTFYFTLPHKHVIDLQNPAMVDSVQE